MSMTSFRLDEDLTQKLPLVAEQMRRSRSWIINDALRQYIERQEREQRMLEETQEALADLEAQRLISGEEVMEWLETWGTEQEGSAPQG